MKEFLIIFLFIFCFSRSHYAANFTHLKFGQYEVGISIEEYTDYSRSYHNTCNNIKDNSRKIKIYTWYPANTNEPETRLKVRDYMKYFVDDFSANKSTFTSENIENHYFFRSHSAKKWAPILNQNTKAYYEPNVLNEPFPLIVIGQGFYFESIASLAILAEYLASHGYIVATCPLKGTYEESIVLNQADLETQIRDLEFVISKSLETNSNISNIGLVGFDLGGLSSMLLTMKNPCIKALISLDGGLLFKHNLEYVKKSPHYNPLLMEAPLLQITRTKQDNVNMGLTEDFSFFDSATHCMKYLMRFENIRHNEFTSYNLMGIQNKGSGFLKIFKDEVHPAIYAIYEYALNFMNAYLKQDETAENYIDEPIDDKSLSINANLEIFRSSNPVLTQSKLQTIILNEGILKGIETLQNEIAKDNGNPILSEDHINEIGYDYLYTRGLGKEAIEILKFNLNQHPNSANAFDSLGEAYMLTGNDKEALKQYKKAYELNPDNKRTKQIIDYLEKRLSDG
jgi:tetratricopeptide (TPR) repeat protein